MENQIIKREDMTDEKIQQLANLLGKKVGDSTSYYNVTKQVNLSGSMMGLVISSMLAADNQIEIKNNGVVATQGSVEKLGEACIAIIKKLNGE